jgi:diacylglycerol O-acyltransferase / wax synthase
MVSRLSGMEAVSLHTESSTVPAHAVALIIIEASDQLSHQRLRELVGSALPQLARFRCWLVGKPLGLGQPVWAEIDGYDPTSQIHSATVPAPGGRREFAELIAWLTTGPLDADALRQLYTPAVGGSISSAPTKVQQVERYKSLYR